MYALHRGPIKIVEFQVVLRDASTYAFRTLRFVRVCGRRPGGIRLMHRGRPVIAPYPDYLYLRPSAEACWLCYRSDELDQDSYPTKRVRVRHRLNRQQCECLLS